MICNHHRRAGKPIAGSDECAYCATEDVLCATAEECERILDLIDYLSGLPEWDATTLMELKRRIKGGKEDEDE